MAQKTRATVDDQKEILQYINFTLTQSAANAFTQLAIPTLIDPNDELIWELQEIDLSPASSFTLSAFTFNLALSVTRNSKASFPGFADPDLISLSRVQGVGAGAPTNQGIGTIEYPFVMPITGRGIIAASNVYAQIASSGFTGAQTFEGRLYYKTVRMSKSDILEILYG